MHSDTSGTNDQDFLVVFNRALKTKEKNKQPSPPDILYNLSKTVHHGILYGFLWDMMQKPTTEFRKLLSFSVQHLCVQVPEQSLVHTGLKGI